MSLTSGRRLKRQSFTPLPKLQDVINGFHRIALRNPKGLDIRDRYRRPFLEPENETNNDEDNSTYALSDDNRSDNEYESDDNQQIHDTFNPAPDQEMAQHPTGVTIQNENTGVHQNENSGVLQNESTHSPQSGHNDPQNDPDIKMENRIDKTGNKNEDENDAENEDENGHEAPDTSENEQEDLEEAPTNNNKTDPTRCRTTWTNNTAHKQELTCGPGNEKSTFL